MFKSGKAQHNAAGNVTKAASYQSKELPKARIEPNRKWFGNTRVISQGALDSFRQAVAERASDPYQVLLKTNKLPMSLIRDQENTKMASSSTKPRSLSSRRLLEIHSGPSHRESELSSMLDLWEIWLAKA